MCFFFLFAKRVFDVWPIPISNDVVAGWLVTEVCWCACVRIFGTQSEMGMGQFGGWDTAMFGIAADDGLMVFELYVWRR